HRSEPSVIRARRRGVVEDAELISPTMLPVASWAQRSQAEIFSEAVNLVHSFVQDSDDPDVAVREPAPIDEVMLVAKETAFDTELGRDGPRQRSTGADAFERLEQALNVAVSLLLTAAVAGVAVDLIKPVGS